MHEDEEEVDDTSREICEKCYNPRLSEYKRGHLNDICIAMFL